jgi:hypothetical protein
MKRQDEHAAALPRTPRLVEVVEIGTAAQNLNG